jgi:predicted nucleic acid-binding protein
MPGNCGIKHRGEAAMIFLDSDIMIDLFREYSPAVNWFDSINDKETMALSGFVVMELIQGCDNKVQL